MDNNKTLKSARNYLKTSSVLEHLFGSRTRVQLLYTFLNQPDRPFYVRELARQIDAQINAVRRELDNLSKDNFINLIAKDDFKNHIAKKKYYIINRNFILFPELKALFNKSHLFLGSELINALKNTRKVSLLILTGSFVDDKKIGTDFLIVGSINRKKLQDMIRQFERNLGFEINYTIMSQEEHNYRKEIGDQFLHRIIEGKHIVAINNL